MKRVAAIVIMILAAGCGSELASTPEPDGRWVQAADGPLGPRENAVAVGVDGRVLVVGGSDAPPCPPGADCSLPTVPPLSDGAIYDPTADQWQRIADSPVPLEWAGTAVSGTTVYFWVQETGRPGHQEAFVAYDVGTGEWSELPLPPSAHADFCCDIAGAGDRIVAYPGTDEFGEQPDHIFDPAAEQWSELPADPLSPTFDRDMVWSGSELIHFAQESLDQRDPAESGLGMVAALDLDTGEWRRLPDTGALHNIDGALIDGRVVHPWLGSADGGQTNNWGRSYPYGGILDPASGEWSALPNEPEVGGVIGVGIVADGESHYLSDDGWVLDLDAGEWGWIEPRPGAGDVPDGPTTAGERIASVGESMLVFGGVRWVGSDYELRDEAWLWHP